MHVWRISGGSCDVVLSAKERLGVGEARLFLCPAAMEIAANHRIGVNTIASNVSAAAGAGVIGKGDTLGRLAISRVVSCVPTSLQKVIDTVNVINWMVHNATGDAPIAGHDIIAAVFALRDLDKAMAVLKLEDEALARRARVPVAFVQSLRKNYRLHLAPVLKLRGVLAHLLASSTAAGADELRQTFDSDPRNAIHAGAAGRPKIEELPRRSEDEERYLLNEGNVEPAPAEGHPWARMRTAEPANHAPSLRVARQAS